MKIGSPLCSHRIEKHQEIVQEAVPLLWGTFNELQHRVEMWTRCQG